MSETKPSDYRVSDFGAIGDGRHDDTDAVERAARRPAFDILNASDGHPIYVAGPVVTLAPGEMLVTDDDGQSYVVGVDRQRRKVTLPASLCLDYAIGTAPGYSEEQEEPE